MVSKPEDVLTSLSFLYYFFSASTQAPITTSGECNWKCNSKTSYFPPLCLHDFFSNGLQSTSFFCVGSVVQSLVQRFRSESLQVRSRRPATFTPSAHVRRQSFPVWPPTSYLFFFIQKGKNYLWKKSTTITTLTFLPLLNARSNISIAWRPLI